MSFVKKITKSVIDNLLNIMVMFIGCVASASIVYANMNNHIKTNEISIINQNKVYQGHINDCKNKALKQEKIMSSIQQDVNLIKVQVAQSGSKTDIMFELIKSGKLARR